MPSDGATIDIVSGTEMVIRMPLAKANTGNYPGKSPIYKFPGLPGARKYDPPYRYFVSLTNTNADPVTHTVRINVLTFGSEWDLNGYRESQLPASSNPQPRRSNSH